MKRETSESEEMSRREFLRRFLPKSSGMVFIDKDKCTGCGLCVTDCPTQALLVRPNGEKDSYQLLFRQEACNACGACETSCPEHCLQFVGKEFEKDETGKETNVIFEDNLTRCVQCGIPLFPRSMVRKLETKLLASKGSTWALSLCPSCRTKNPLSSRRGEGKSEGGILP
jgi:2-oxoglutarate ferredoxin oxidoreductase subunit delta